MAKNDNILRIKINGISLLKFSRQHYGRDFLISYPLLHSGESAVESHLTFHSPNGRITFKITSVKYSGKELLPQIVETVKNHPMYKNKIVPTGIDLFKETKLLDFDDPQEIYAWGKMSFNLKDSSLVEYLEPTKTPDNRFKIVKDIKIPLDKNDKVTIKFGIAKNFIGNLSKLKGRFDDHIQVEESSLPGDRYTFFFFIEYSFPDVSEHKKVETLL